jgi:hypothetical protein
MLFDIINEAGVFPVNGHGDQVFHLAIGAQVRLGNEGKERTENEGREY